MIMKNFLNEEMLQKMFAAINEGKTFNYDGDNMKIAISPNGISISYHESSKDSEVKTFLNYCDKLDDDFFVEVCESFADGELEFLQSQLDTDNYRDTITKFHQRVKDIADSKLSEIINTANTEIQNQELIISKAQDKIKQIQKDLDNVTIKYRH